MATKTNKIENNFEKATKVKNKWCLCNENQQKVVFKFNEGYMKFLSENKTERECAAFCCAEAEKHGFVNLDTAIKNQTKLKAGDKVYAVNRDKSVALFVLGTDKFESGLNILGAHIDSPRLDLKQNPLYEKNGFCLMDTHYYGGIKYYQWITLPLAMHGVVVKKNGTVINVNIGEKENDPVFYISDLLPHLKKEAGKEEVSGEQLDIVVGNMSFKKDKEDEVVIENLRKILKTSYNIEEDDLISAELEIVPAGRARDLGLDRSMVVGYGHDDRSCAYTSLQAILECEKPKRTAVCLLVDKEEIGSNGATGMKSRFFENVVAEVMNLAGQYNNELSLKRTLTNSNMISSDVTAGYDPSWAAAYNIQTDAFLACGISFNKYTGHRGKSGANDAAPEYIAKLRKILEDNKIFFQFTEMGKVDQGGGGTIAYILAEYGMNVIDAGIPLLSMHAPFEVASKLDIYHAYLFYKAFLKDMK